MIDYQKLKEKVSVRDYAESIGYEISGNGMIRCPFHNDRTPSMKIDESHYHCFGCGAHGDVIGFVAELYGISNCAAAKRIMDEFGLDSDDYSRSDNPPPTKKKESLREWRNNTVAYYIYLEKAMKKCIDEYKPKESDETLHPMFAYSVKNIGYIGYIIDCLMDCMTDDEILRVKGMIEDNG